MDSWSAAHAHIPIVWGEFGCAVEQTNETARLDWYHQYVAMLNTSSSVSAWSFWDDDGDFKIFQRSSGTWDEQVLGAMGL